MAGLRGTTEQVAAIWRKIGLNQKLSIVLVGLGSAAALTALCFWSSRPDYGLLYGNLSRKDAAAIITQLQADGVDYKTEDNETAVLVPAEQVHAVRASLLTQGLPAGGPGGEGGFELLDESPIGMTDFRERKTYLRAAQCELARKISHVEAI